MAKKAKKSSKATKKTGQGPAQVQPEEEPPPPPTLAELVGEKLDKPQSYQNVWNQLQAKHYGDAEAGELKTVVCNLLAASYKEATGKAIDHNKKDTEA